MARMLMMFVLVAAAAGADEPPRHVREYLRRCEAARQATVAAKEHEIKSLAADAERLPAAAGKLKTAREELARLKSQPAQPLAMPLPPAKDDVGVLQSTAADGRRGSVDVIEVIDEHNAILRVWHVRPPAEGNRANAQRDPVPLDLWAEGIDTSGMKDRSKAELKPVFVLLGNKTFATDCGTRTLPLVAPIDVERYRGGQK